MVTVLRRGALLLLLIGLAAGPAFSQAAPAENPSFRFGMSLGIGVQTFNEPQPVTYQSLSLFPDISYGKLGVGLAITLNYNFTGPGNSLYLRSADWAPTDFQSFLQIYLAKINYIRWGLKGDPLFIKLGSFDDVTLGDGFIAGDYTNMYFLPQDRHLGLQADLDGSLFAFPYVGVETFAGNLALMDVLGGRLSIRPLAGTDVAILKDMQVGGTLVADTGSSNPLQSSTEPAAVAPGAPVYVYGGDIRVPLFSVKDTASMIAFTDVATIDSQSVGGAVGMSGRLIDIFTYGAQLRLMQASFIPDYFGPLYDVSRQTDYLYVTSGVTGSTFGYLVSLGTSLFGDKLVFTVAVDGPFETSATLPSLQYPELRAILSVGEGVVPGFSFSFSYDKQSITTFGDLISQQNGSIAARINFRSGPAVISFVYQLSYMPGQNPNPIITSGLQSAVALF
ncbi:MAG: hypothetical protein ACLQCB_21675 [Spirochaetia bacterium]